MKYVTATRALMPGILKILNLSEILPFCFVDRLYLSVAVTYWRQILQYLVGFRGNRKIIAIRGKFAAVCRGIWQTGPRNLEKFAAENCDPYKSVYCGLQVSRRPISSASLSLTSDRSLSMSRRSCCSLLSRYLSELTLVLRPSAVSLDDLV